MLKISFKKVQVSRLGGLVYRHGGKPVLAEVVACIRILPFHPPHSSITLWEELQTYFIL